ncbi:MAG: hypothetical protein IK990_04050 [Ruminiclostridium sp.]|nr:hypothetical protein [Ruminiclostridium sp.]
MYKNIFLKQWEDLAALLYTELNKDPTPLKNAEALNRWYKTASYRWSSVSSVESIQLEQQGNPDFTAALRSEIAAFSFSPVESKALPPAWGGLAAGAAGGVAVAAVVKTATELSLLPAAGIGAVVLGGAALGYNSAVMAPARKKQHSEKNNSYLSQLREHSTRLSAVFDRYNIS